MPRFETSNIYKLFFLTAVFAFLFFGIEVFAADCLKPPQWNTTEGGGCTVNIEYKDPPGGAGLSQCLYKVVSNGITIISWTPIDGACSGTDPVIISKNITIGAYQNCRDQGTGACVIYSKAIDGSGNEGIDDQSLNICLGCLIGGTCYSNGAYNSTNKCKICDPSQSKTDWSNVEDATDPANWCTATWNSCDGSGSPYKCQRRGGDGNCYTGACDTNHRLGDIASGYVCTGLGTETQGSDTYYSGLSTFNACGGVGSPYSCRKSRDKLACDGFGGKDGPDVGDDWLNVGAGKVCSGGSEMSASTTYYCGFSSYNNRSVDKCDKKKDYLACNGSNVCSEGDYGDKYEPVSANKIANSSGSEIDASSSDNTGTCHSCTAGFCSGTLKWGECDGLGNPGPCSTYNQPETVYANSSYTLTSTCGQTGTTNCDSSVCWDDSSHHEKCNRRCNAAHNCDYYDCADHCTNGVQDCDETGIDCGGSCSVCTFTLTVIKAGTGSGTVASLPAGINCGTDCSEPYLPGTLVTLTAAASSGSYFAGWSVGECSGTGNCAMIMDGAKTVTATFTICQCTTKSAGGCCDGCFYCPAGTVFNGSSCSILSCTNYCGTAGDFCTSDRYRGQFRQACGGGSSCSGTIIGCSNLQDCGITSNSCWSKCRKDYAYTCSAGICGSYHIYTTALQDYRCEAGNLVNSGSCNQSDYNTRSADKCDKKYDLYRCDSLGYNDTNCIYDVGDYWASVSANKIANSSGQEIDASSSDNTGTCHSCTAGFCSGTLKWGECDGLGNPGPCSTYNQPETVYANSSYTLTSTCGQTGTTNCDSSVCWDDSSHHEKCNRRCNAAHNCDYYDCADHCTNGVQDCDETGIDCGGSCLSCNNPPTISSVSDSPDPISPFAVSWIGSSMTFTVNWSDPDVGDQTKIHICKTNSISGQTCSGGSWCDTTSWSNSSPSSCSYTTLVSDAGTKSYYAFVCDKSNSCSSSKSGTFLVDVEKPKITSFSVSPTLLNIANPEATVSWTASDGGGSHLWYTNVFRATGDTGGWEVVKTIYAPADFDGPWTASAKDDNPPPPDGTYWYGIHIMDRAGNDVNEGDWGFSIVKVTVDKTRPPKPTCSPGTGKYTDAVAVVCSDTESGVTIRYTTNGTTPTVTSSQYTSTLTFTLNTTLTVAAWDTAGNRSDSPDNSYVYTINKSPTSTIYRWQGSSYLDDPGQSWQKANFTRYIYDYDSDGSLSQCEYYTYDNITSTTTASSTRTPCTNGAFNSKTITLKTDNNCPSQGKDACTLGVRCKDNDGAFSTYDTATYHIDWTPPVVGTISPTLAQANKAKIFSAIVSDNVELNYCWLYVGGEPKGSMEISPSPCRNGASCTASKEYLFDSPGTYSVYASCADQYDSQSGTYLNSSSGTSINITVATLDVNLEVIPPSGTIYTNFTLKDTVSGTMSGTVNFMFDCKNDGDWETKYNGIDLSISDGDWVQRADYYGHTFYTKITSPNSFAVKDLCNYTTTGTHTAKTFIERGAGDATDTASINISANLPPTAGICCQNCTSQNCTTYTGGIFTLVNNSSDPNGLGDIIKSEWDILSWGSDPDLLCTSPALCGFTVQTQILGQGDYTAELYVEDLSHASNIATKSFTIKQDAIADFRCSLNNINWQSCASIRPGVEETVHFLDQSSPSQGALINNRSWVFSDGNPTTNIDNNPNPKTQFQSPGSKQVSLTITDNQSRTASRNYNITVQLPLPEWEEIAPF